MIYYAHKKENGEVHLLRDHLTGTAELAEKFAQQFGIADYGRLAGLSHDIGKYSKEFQYYMMNGGSGVEHSAASAEKLTELFTNKMFAYILAYCTGGHHSGLPDGGSASDTDSAATLIGKLKRQERKGCDYSAYKAEIDLEKHSELNPPSVPEKPAAFRDFFTVSVYIRMLYSALVDADFLDTEKFMNDEIPRGSGDDFELLCRKFTDFTEKNFSAPKTDIHKKRNEIFEAASLAAESGKGLFSLTVPTGGGKTLSSMNFALKHTLKNGARRIIYVIPYTSIIEQTAQIFRDIFGDENVLAHYSTVSFDYAPENLREETEYKKILASENWDSPIVVTTNVQFFESFFANKSSRCRKLHNISNSVVIFDEAQMLPNDYLEPCTRIIAALVLNFKCSAVLCTATQPSLAKFFEGMEIKEICRNCGDLQNFFRRVQIKCVGKKTVGDLASDLKKHAQVLCIVNTKLQAIDLYNEIDTNADGVYYLTTNLCPADRSRIFKEISDRLRDESRPVCRVIATSLVEAGVDFDFPAVYRERAGIDSIIQAAGRCNREGKRLLAESFVYVFEPDDIYKNKIHANLKLPIAISEMLFESGTDPSEPSVIKRYFDKLHEIRGGALDKKNIVKRFNRQDMIFPFETVAREFKLIETARKSIFVPINEEAAELAEQLRAGKVNRKIMRAAGAYMINVYDAQYNNLHGAGDLEVVNMKNSNIAILRNTERYGRKTGLYVPETGIGIFI